MYARISSDRRTGRHVRTIVSLVVAIGATLALSPAAFAAKPADRKATPKYGEYNSAHASVELFAAIESGQIEVKFIPRNAEKARLLITNKSDVPLNVELPKVFAARPALAQFQPGGMGPLGGQGQGGPGGGQGGGGQNQAVGAGGGRGQNGGGLNGMMNNQQGGGANFFNVPPEKTATIKLGVLCLEHGKPNPRAKVPYEVVRIDQITTDKAVHAIIEQFANDKLAHKVAQAAVWHGADDMSWQELAGKTISRAGGLRELYFQNGEVDAAKKAFESVTKKLTDSASSSETSSSESTDVQVQFDAQASNGR